MGERSHGLEAWVERLNDAELLAMAGVVADLLKLSDPDESSIQQLAVVLLRDASLTSKVLRVACSSYYNPAQEPIKSISRAIVLIGFDSVRLISMSVTLIDSLLARAPREQLRELLARSFHAAVQARNVAEYVLSQRKEEVFIAALLHSLGELAFWSCGGEQVDEVAEQMAEPGANLAEVVHEVLGTDFRQLTMALVKRWNLDETILLAQNPINKADPVARVVTLGVQISQMALSGWHTPEMAGLIEQVADLTKLDAQEAMAQVLASADEAVQVANTFGAGNLSHLIPSTDPEVIRAQQLERQARLLHPDLALMQQALIELGSMVSAKGDLNKILETLMRGLHKGAGLERVMLTVLADGQSCFRAKRAVGDGTQAWLDEFQLPVGASAQAHIFSYALRNRETLWMGVPASYSLNDLVTVPMRKWLGQGMFFIAPILAGQREIGVVYADSRHSGRSLKHEQFVAFQRFTQLAGRCLEALSRVG